MLSRLAGITLLCGLLAGLAACNGARSTALDVGAAPNGTGFLQKTINTEAGPRPYALFVPRHCVAGQKYPMIVFLHGIGESGSDISKPLCVGLAPFVADHADDFPFFVLFPQSTGGWDENSQDAKNAIATIETVTKQYPIDPDRISLTGLSTGGYGTFAIGAKYNSVFAALVPMCPSGGASHCASTLAKMNIWAFENAADPFVAPGSMAGTLGAIKSAGGNPKHTVYGAFGHDCWERAYAEGELFIWLQQQRRNAPAAATPPAAAPNAHSSTAAPSHSAPVPSANVVAPY